MCDLLRLCQHPLAPSWHDVRVDIIDRVSVAAGDRKQKAGSKDPQPSFDISALLKVHLTIVPKLNVQLIN